MGDYPSASHDCYVCDQSYCHTDTWVTVVTYDPRLGIVLLEHEPRKAQEQALIKLRQELTVSYVRSQWRGEAPRNPNFGSGLVPHPRYLLLLSSSVNGLSYAHSSYERCYLHLGKVDLRKGVDWSS